LQQNNPRSKTSTAENDATAGTWRIKKTKYSWSFIVAQMPD